MSKTHLKIRNGISFPGVAADPSDAQNGDIIYRSDSNIFKFYQNGSWITLGTLPYSSFSMANNSTGDVTGLLFSSSTDRSAIVNYSIHRRAGTPEYTQVGQLRITYKNLAGVWEIIDQYSGDSAGVTFSISAGQVAYSSTNEPGTQTDFVMKWQVVSTFPQ
jgi:hypothetical protein